MIRKLVASLALPLAAAAFALGSSPAAVQARPAHDVLTEYYYDAAFQQYAGFTWLTCNGGFISSGVTNTAFSARDGESCSTGELSQKLCYDCSGGSCVSVTCPPDMFLCTDPGDPNCPPY